MQKYVWALCVIYLLLDLSLGLEFNRQQQRYNPNTDFLLHEGSAYVGNNKNSNAETISSVASSQQNANQNGDKRDYVDQFPPLQPPATPKPLTEGKNNRPNSGKRDFVAISSQTPSVTPKSTSTVSWSTQLSGGKRDYVAPQYPTLKPIQGAVTPKSTAPFSTVASGGKRDYVAPQYPTFKPVAGAATSNPSTTVSFSTTASGGKRDYIAPQYPTLKPVHGTSQPTGGKVKDLVNFYDSKNGQPTPQKTPSYSSILSGSTSINTPSPTSTTSLYTQTTPKPGSGPTKPLSFSSIVSGSKSPNTHTTGTTPSTPTRLPSKVVTTRPGSPVLPSSIVNRNRMSNVTTDLELQTLSEELLRKDVNNAAKYVTVNYQEKTTSQSKDDKAPSPLLTISQEAWNIPTIQTLVPLLDNYERDTLTNEYVTPQERNEENAFMDAIMSTSVIRHLMNFLKEKGYVTPDPRQQRDFLKQLWFSLYSRGKGKISSSGFEHVFVSEVRNGDILGLHNWIYFAKEEAANRVNYLGYLKYVQLSDKGAVLKLHFNQQGSDKPVGTMLIGTSPEMEIALYTLCFVTRADNDCKLKLANNDVDIVTHTFRYRSKNLIGSAYPQIPSNYNY